MSRLLHPWAAVAPGDTHALIADDSDCLLMAAMAAGREAQSLFVLAEPQLGRSIAFGPDGLPQPRGAAAAGGGARPGSRGMASAASSGSLSSAPSSPSSVFGDGDGAEGAPGGAVDMGQAAPAGAGAAGGGRARPAHGPLQLLLRGCAARAVDARAALPGRRRQGGAGSSGRPRSLEAAAGTHVAEDMHSVPLLLLRSKRLSLLCVCRS